MSVTLEQLVDDAIDGVLDEHRAEVEAIVASRIRRRLDELIRSIVAGELDGDIGDDHGHHLREVGDIRDRRQCATCGERPALDGRRDCARCKSRRQRQRTQETPPAPTPGTDEPTADPALVEHEDAADAAAEPAAPMPRVPPVDLDKRPARRRTVAGRLMSADAQDAARERAELIASVEPEVEVDDAGRAWQVRKLPATFVPLADRAPVAAD